jgi:hypothetical protein
VAKSDVIPKPFQPFSPGVMSKVQSAAEAIATTVPDAVQTILPKNCSLGTSYFCIGSGNDVSCSRLPLNLADVIPDQFAGTLEGGKVASFDAALSKISASLNGTCFIGGIILFFIHILAILLWIYGPKPKMKLVIPALGLFCMVPFLVEGIVLSILWTKTAHLPPWIRAQPGNVYGLCWGSFSCAGFCWILGMVYLYSCRKRE